MNTNTFIQALREVHAECEALLAQMDEARMLQAGIEGAWSVKDLLAHMTWYEREMIPIVNTRVFAGSDLWAEDVDTRNAAIHQQQPEGSLQEVMSAWRQAYSDFVVAAQTLSDDDLNDPHRFQGMPEEWQPWQVFASNTFEHEREHLSALHRWVVQ